MMDDKQLLHAYARERSESAFGELVTRHIDFVYSTALRVVNGDSHLAQDVAQTVFIELAREARSLPGGVGLAGWLHHHTCYTAAKAVRTERRRKTREETAMEMRALDDNTRPEWELVAPYLDESLDQLNPADRDALVLRFLKQQDFRAVGEALGISDDAARKRVDRALEKLHVLLKRRGATLSAAALGTALATEAVTAAPAGLAASIASSALAGTTASPGLVATLLKVTTLTKAQVSFLGTLILAGAVASLTIQQRAHATLQAQGELLGRQSDELARRQAEHERLVDLVRAGGSAANTVEDLTRLRDEVASLRKEINGLALSPEERRRLQAQTAQAPAARSSILERMEEDKRGGIARLNYTRKWLIAFRAYADHNDGRFPSSFDEARPYLPAQTGEETNLSTDQFQILYWGPVTNIANPDRVVILREKQPRPSYKGGWTRTHAFLDGHSEVSFSPDGNFDAWEKQKIFLPTPGQ